MRFFGLLPHNMTALCMYYAQYCMRVVCIMIEFMDSFQHVMCNFVSILPNNVVL